jgi:hypothetical protein
VAVRVIGDWEMGQGFVLDFLMMIFELVELADLMAGIWASLKHARMEPCSLKKLMILQNFGGRLFLILVVVIE